MEIMTKLEDMWAQLESSWPRTMEKILKEFNHNNEEFYIYTFFKWYSKEWKWNHTTKQNEIVPLQIPRYEIYHQPRRSWPDALPGTVLRKVSPSGGWAKIIWALPHQEGFSLYESGKMFADPIVNESIRKYLAGELKQEPEEKFQKI